MKQMKTAILVLVAITLSGSLLASDALNRNVLRCIKRNHRGHGNVQECVDAKLKPNPSDSDFSAAVRVVCRDADTGEELEALGFEEGEVGRCISWSHETHYEEQRRRRRHHHRGHYGGHGGYYGPGYGPGISIGFGVGGGYGHRGGYWW